MQPMAYGVIGFALYVLQDLEVSKIATPLALAHF